MYIYVEYGWGVCREKMCLHRTHIYASSTYLDNIQSWFIYEYSVHLNIHISRFKTIRAIHSECTQRTNTRTTFSPLPWRAAANIRAAELKHWCWRSRKFNTGPVYRLCDRRNSGILCFVAQHTQRARLSMRQYRLPSRLPSPAISVCAFSCSFTTSLHTPYSSLTVHWVACCPDTLCGLCRRWWCGGGLLCRYPQKSGCSVFCFVVLSYMYIELHPYLYAVRQHIGCNLLLVMRCKLDLIVDCYVKYAYMTRNMHQ